MSITENVKEIKTCLWPVQNPDVEPVGFSTKIYLMNNRKMKRLNNFDGP